MASANDGLGDLRAGMAGLTVDEQQRRRSFIDKYKEFMAQLKRDFEEELTHKLKDEGSLKEPITSAFHEKIEKIVNPLEYAWPQHVTYVETYMPSKVKVLFVGMNPSPYAPSGIPFGDEEMMMKFVKFPVPKKQLLGIHPFLTSEQYVEEDESSKECPSGKRFWEFIKSHFKNIDMFCKDCFVMNCSPLIFTRFTPNRKKGLPGLHFQQNISLEEIEHSKDTTVISLKGKSQSALGKVIELMETELKLIVAIGGYAFKSVDEFIGRKEDGERKIELVLIDHPSPKKYPKDSDWTLHAQTKLSSKLLEICNGQ